MDETLKINCQRAFKEIVDALIDLEEYFTIEDMDSNMMLYYIDLLYNGAYIRIDWTQNEDTVLLFDGARVHCYYFNDPDWIAKFINKIWEMQDARNSGN